MERSIAVRQLGAAVATLGLLALGPARASADLDLANFGALLGQYTSETPEVVGTRVNYRGLAADPRWRALLAGLEASKPSALVGHAERLAFWINAYNVLAMRMVIDHYPVDSIRDIGWLLRPVWKRPIARIEGTVLSLDQIEHDILRKMGEPRIHGAIVCASISCPSLAHEPYDAHALEDQLDASMRRFLANPGKGMRVDRARGEVVLSRIFKWYAGDFENAGGVLAFATRYAREAERTWIEANGADLEVDHFGYDWSLNDWRR
jgi:hypothetical protein